MNNKERRIELQRLRDLAYNQWDAKSHELASMWGAVRFLDEQIQDTDKLITEEETRKREAELSIAKRTPEKTSIDWAKENSDEPIPQEEGGIKMYPKKGSILR